MPVTLSDIKKAFLGYFDDWTLSKGRSYIAGQKVLDMRNRSDDEIEGRVSGSMGQKYLTRLYLDHFGCKLIETDCSCPVGIDCKHAAAVYIKHIEQVPLLALYASLNENPDLLYSSPTSKVSSFEAPAAVATETEIDPAMLPLPSEISNSFKEFAQSIAPQREARVARKTAPTSKLVYLIGLEAVKGEPKIEIRSVSISKAGTLSKGTKISPDKLLSNPPIQALDEDLEIIRFWFSISKSMHYWNGNYSLIDADSNLVQLLMTKILATNRCFFNAAGSNPLQLGPELPAELSWEEHQPQFFRLGLVARDGDNLYKCMRSSALPWYIDEEKSLCGPVSAPFEPKKLKPLLDMRNLTLDEAQRLPLLLNNLALSNLIPTPDVPNRVNLRVVNVGPTLEIQTQRSLRPVVLPDQRIIPAGEEIRTLTISTHSDSNGMPYRDESGQLIVSRTAAFETERARLILSKLGFGELPPAVFGEIRSDKLSFMAPNPASWSHFSSEGLDKLREIGWNISEEMETACQPVEIEDEAFDFELSGEDNWWFSLALDIDVNGKTVSLLPVLVSAIRKLSSSESIGDSIDTLNQNGRFIGHLSDGTMISIPFERIRSILISIKELIEKGLDPNGELPAVDAADVFSDETLSRNRFIGSAKILRLVQMLTTLKQIQTVAAPENFKTTLRPYQLEGLSWLQFLAEQEFAGILADDMGLGKTIQLLAHICLEKENGRLKSPYLVLCPTSVLPNWLSEAEKFAPHLNVVSFHGLARYENLERMKSADLVVTTYPLLSRDLSTFSNVTWHGVALDEAQAIKNYKTKMAQAARSLKANHRFCLTGTPVENHLGELWSQFQFLLPGLLGDSNTFKNVFRDPIEKIGDVHRRKMLARRVKPFIMRRTKQEVAQELPDKTVIVQNIELEGDQRDLYETVRLASVKQVREEIAKKGFKHSQIMILDALLKMRQVCCDPRLVKLSAAATVTSTAKLDALIEMLEQQIEEGHKVLVFSQFTSMLELIEARLRESKLSYVKLTGETKDRAKPVKEFQEGSTPIFLISLKAGGTGLNLTQADVVIHYDPWWNPAVEEQATDRAHRIGQTKKVFVYKLIAKGTIEQRMVEMQERKRSIASSVYDEDGNFNLKFTEQDLEALLQPID
ncbi:DEAD/DEAH box helicase [Candidatus Obscuribacterales bacterium]|nr:DEAD/DEAH box helicase [Candidatus Obscuribacterales bacterium]